MRRLVFPIDEETVQELHIRDRILISGKIFCGRDAVLPKIAEMIEKGQIADAPFDLNGGLVFHSAVSRAGVGPTSSNKLEIEGTMEALSKGGVRMHVGKGRLKKETVEILKENHSVFAVMPPVTALLNSRTISRKCVAFPELGMEALYELEVEDFPAVIAVAGGESIFES